MRRLAVAYVTLALAFGAAVAGSIDVDFNPKAEFHRYRTWAWMPGRDQNRRGVLADATMRERVEQAIGIRLREAGLRAVSPDEKPDLLVTYQGDMGQGKSGSSNIGGLSSLDNPVYTSIQFTVQTATLMVDLVDAATNALAWRLYVDQKIGGPTDSADKFGRALDKGFAKYPPSPAEVAKKAGAQGKSSGAK